jgi:hypothetical protein
VGKAIEKAAARHPDIQQHFVAMQGRDMPDFVVLRTLRMYEVTTNSKSSLSFHSLEGCMVYVRRDGLVHGYTAGPGVVVDGAHIERCEIFNLRFDLPKDPGLRPVFRNITLIDNIYESPGLEGAFIEDAVVDGIRTLRQDDLALIEGCIFRHLILRGDCGGVNILNGLGIYRSQYVKDAYLRANNEYWDCLLQSGDWAIDIAAAHGDISLRGIPSTLVRRDPEIQVIMTFEQALSGLWREVSGIGESGFLAPIHMLLESGWRDVLLIARTDHPRFAHDVRVLRDLQRRGAALPD